MTNQTGSRMETYTLANRADLWVGDCPDCGIVFAMPNAMAKRRREDGRTFWCPNGHSMSWHEDEADRQRKRADRLDKQLTRARAEEDRARAEAAHQAKVAAGYKGAMVKAKKRSAKGMCPVPGCHRHFADVQRHVRGQHPDFDPEHAEP